MNSDKPILYEEYDKNCFKIECTETYFSKHLDHSKLNDGHYFIHIKKDFPRYSSPIHVVCMRLVFAKNCTTDSEIYMLPVASCKFGKDSELLVGIESDQQLKTFNECKYWQLEILDQHELYVITAPEKPKISAI